MDLYIIEKKKKILAEGPSQWNYLTTITYIKNLHIFSGYSFVVFDCHYDMLMILATLALYLLSRISQFSAQKLYSLPLVGH